ncbi:MAG TPA: glycoside hydrolase family 15 protein [Candidatus Paceibacterota bacterium]|nr:glycoside hydrolase family 15 protein [Candidatus Paceibacterota bacterium]
MRSLVLGNGSLLITLDRFGEARDIYFPHAGLENHAGGKIRHRIGVYCDGSLSWLSEDPGWDIRVECDSNSLESRITAAHAGRGVRLSFRDIVYNESPIFLRRVTVANLVDRARELRVYFAHDFEISRVPGGDTAYFDPKSHTIIHYKDQRAFLVNGECDDATFSEYAVGLANIDGRDGTYRDAEDGTLSGNAIEHGSVDSIIGFYGQYGGGGEKTIRYWLAAGDSIDRVLDLNAYVLKKSPDHLVKTAGDFWRAWCNKYAWSFYKMSEATIALFKKSLMFVRAHVDDGGGIIASSDAEVLQFKEDTYAYVWPRDAAYAALALERAGDTNIAERFFDFCNAVITKEGYFMHKYLPDRSLGSSWQPWIKDGVEQLPIQEDETAIVIWALADHYRHGRDLEFIEKLYNPLIEKAANFMVEYRDPATGLPKASYDLWEEKHGTATYTAAAVYGALVGTASLARLLGKEDRERFYLGAAAEVKEGILKHLLDPVAGGFAKMLTTSDGETVCDHTPDLSSPYGVFAFGVLPPEDPRLEKAFADTATRLSVGAGIARYEGDQYYATSSRSNPWFIATLWHAEYLTARAKTEDDFAKVRDVFEWVAAHAQPSGVLSEQLSATDGTQCSVAPLTWSHAAYVNAVLAYLDRLEALGICASCDPAP